MGGREEGRKRGKEEGGTDGKQVREIGHSHPRRFRASASVREVSCK